MKVSFDFDSTLSRKAIQKFAKQLIVEGHEVWIVTSREINNKPLNWNKDLFRVSNHIDIPSHHIHFTEMENKWEFFKENSDFLFHVDDDNFEILDINKQTNVIGVSCWPPTSLKWKEECIKILKNV